MTIGERCRRCESFLVANDGTFLGKLSLNPYDIESVSNLYGLYGSHYSATSINNEFSVYGSKFSALSPYNQFTGTPPKIYLRGEFWGYLTINRYLYANSITPSELKDWMHMHGLF